MCHIRRLQRICGALSELALQQGTIQATLPPLDLPALLVAARVRAAAAQEGAVAAAAAVAAGSAAVVPSVSVVRRLSTTSFESPPIPASPHSLDPTSSPISAGVSTESVEGLRTVVPSALAELPAADVPSVTAAEVMGDEEMEESPAEADKENAQPKGFFTVSRFQLPTVEAASPKVPLGVQPLAEVNLVGAAVEGDEGIEGGSAGSGTTQKDDKGRKSEGLSNMNVFSNPLYSTGL